MFPTASSTIYRNEAGEPIGWDSPESFEPPYDDTDYDDDSGDDAEDEDAAPPAHSITFQAARHTVFGACSCGSWTVTISTRGTNIAAATDTDRRSLAEAEADQHLDQVSAIGEDDTAGWHWETDGTWLRKPEQVMAGVGPVGAALDNAVRCPTVPNMPNGEPHSVVGCGSSNVSEPDDEGLYDCGDCGIWFAGNDQDPKIPQERA